MKTDAGKEFPTMESEWQRYHSNVYPNGMAPQQAIECQQAFMSGAWVMFELVSVASAAFKNEDAAARCLELLRKEAVDFNERRLKEMENRN